MGGLCPGKFTHRPCLTTALRFNYDLISGWALMRHAGIHNHPWPKSKKCNPLARSELQDAVANNPSARAFKLKVRSFFICFSYDFPLLIIKILLSAQSPKCGKQKYSGEREIHPPFTDQQGLACPPASHNVEGLGSCPQQKRNRYQQLIPI